MNNQNFQLLRANMIYNQSEISLAKKYIAGEYTDVQFNYLIVQNKLNKKKMRRLVEYVKTTEPFYVACKLMIGFMLIHFLVCFAFSFWAANN